MPRWVKQKSLNILVAIVFVVASIFAPIPASATPLVLCSGNNYSTCINAGYTDHGYGAASGNSYWTMYAGHNCTNYAAYMAIKNGAGYPPTNLGNAYQWASRAPQNIVNHTPAVGAIAQWNANAGGASASGHVAYVEEVTSSHIIISEDNYSSGPFRWRKINTGDAAWPSNFIHFADVAPVVNQPVTGPDDPKGNFEAMQQSYGGVRLTGWALDPNSSNPIAVHVYEGNCCGNPRGAYTADIARWDVATAFPNNGAQHGFDIELPLPVGVSGSKTYCVYAINVGAGSISPELGCRTVTFNWNPKGNYEGIRRAPGGVKLSGWTIDPDGSQSTSIHVYEGNCCGNLRGAFGADLSRPDVGAAMPGYGNLHGFDAAIGAYPTSPTQKTYCVYAINIGHGNASPELGCRSITVSPDTEGNYEGIYPTTGGARVTGWALDPDVAAPVGIHIYENGSIVGGGTANIARPDVAHYWPDYGETHGFDITVPLAPGAHNLCLYSINDSSSAGISKNLGCRSVTVN